VGPTEQDLCALRDALVADLRRLSGAAPEAFPEEVKRKGILERAGPLLAAQAGHIDALAALDLGATGSAARARVLEALTRALHIPRMVIALGEVLRQDTKSEALRPLQEQAARLAARLQGLGQLWALHQAGLDPGLFDEDELDDAAGGEDDVVDI
jgi:hypothetical protein